MRYHVKHRLLTYVNALTATFDRTKPALTPWNALDLVWEGTEAEVQRGLPPSQLAPAWQMMLLGTAHRRAIFSSSLGIQLKLISLTCLPWVMSAIAPPPKSFKSLVPAFVVKFG